MPTVSVAPVASSVEEGADAQFTVTRTVVTTGVLTVRYGVSESGDMVASGEEGAQTLDFSGNTTSLTVTVPTVEDSAHEADSTVTVTLTADAAYRFGAKPDRGRDGRGRRQRGPGRCADDRRHDAGGRPDADGG